MNEIANVPGKVADLMEEVGELKQARENSATRLAALELKAATAGKVSGMDLVKVAGLVVAVSTLVSSMVGIYVEGKLAESLQQIRERQARTETAVEFLRERKPGGEVEGGAE
jgi:phage shock protein A